MDVFWYLLARQRGGGGGAQLLAPTIAQSGSNLTLTNPSGNGGFAEYFNIYNGNELLATLPISTTAFDLTTLGAGTYSLTATVGGDKMKESEKSTAVAVSVYAVTLALTNISASPSATKIITGVPLTINLSTSGNYILPNSVAVSGATSVFTRTNDTSGSVALSSPTGAVTVTAAAIEKLATPSLSVSGDTLTIETSDFNTEHFAIYVDAATTPVQTIPR